MVFTIVAAALISASVVLADDNPYGTYPPVPKSASINGFADPIYDKLPTCAQSCVKRSTSNTPCPYWDTGCLCIMPQFEIPIAQCIADQCKGQDVVVATSLAKSICTSAGIYWNIPASASTFLDAAATAVVSTSAAPSSSPAPTSSQPPSSQPASTDAPSSQPLSTAAPSSQPSSTEAPQVTKAPSSSNPFGTYPPVSKTASINGFADPIYDDLPACAQSCVTRSTSNTPCPYWDTGCLCIMPQFEGPIAQCIADQCKGRDVASATSLAKSICTSAGIYWNIPASYTPLLEAAAAATSSASSVSASTSASSSATASTPASISASASSVTSSVAAEVSSAAANSSSIAHSSTDAPSSATNSAVPASYGSVPAFSTTTASFLVPESSATPISVSSSNFGNFSTAAPITSAGQAAETKTNYGTTVVTITSCSDNKCTAHPVTTGWTVISEEHTVYTTYCPLTDQTTATTKGAATAETATATGAGHKPAAQSTSSTGAQPSIVPQPSQGFANTLAPQLATIGALLSAFALFN